MYLGGQRCLPNLPGCNPPSPQEADPLEADPPGHVTCDACLEAIFPPLPGQKEWHTPVTTLPLADLGGHEGRTPPPGRPNSFDFMQFSGKFGVFTPPPGGFTPPLGKILDPPLITFSQPLLWAVMKWAIHFFVARPTLGCSDLFFYDVTVADLRGTRGTHAPPPGELAPSSGKSWIRHCVMTQPLTRLHDVMLRIQ